jgi:hypothetical protein
MAQYKQFVSASYWIVLTFPSLLLVSLQYLRISSERSCFKENVKSMQKYNSAVP